APKPRSDPPCSCEWAKRRPGWRGSAGRAQPARFERREAEAQEPRDRQARRGGSTGGGSMEIRASGNLLLVASPPALWRRSRQVSAREPLYIRDLDDFVALAAARRVHFNAIAGLLADQRPCRRRGDRHLAGLHVRLGFADDLKHASLLGVLVDQRDGGAELDGRSVQFLDVDHLGPLQQLLELDDAALVMRLRLLGRVIFGVFRQVAVTSRLRDRGDDARPLDLLAMVKFRLEGRMARGGDR